MLDYMLRSPSILLSLDREERSRLELAARVQGLSVEELLRAAVGLPRERPTTVGDDRQPAALGIRAY
jgi:hypothetical protein